MALTLSCFILDHGEDALTHWFEIELRDGGKTLDGDFFRWAKATKRVLLNPQFDGDGNQIDPAIQVPTAIWEDREGNTFDYDEVMETAARHFLRRQGVLTKLEQWLPTGIRRISGTVVSKTDGRTLAARRAAMAGAVIEVDDATRTVALKELKLHRGTVSTISTNYDGLVTETPLRIDTGSVLEMRGNTGITDFRRRSFTRFPLAVIGASDTVSNVDIKINIVVALGITNEARIQAYNIDGQADPNTDTDANAYTRCKDDSSPYLSGGTQWESTGVKTITIAADADVEAAVDTPDRFSLGFSLTSAENTVTDDAVCESIEDAGTDEPKLVVTHENPPAYEQVSFRFRNDDGPLGELA